LSRLDWRLGTVKNYRHDPHNSNTLNYDDIRCIDEDNDGAIWLATKNGLDKLDASGTVTHFRYDPNDSTSLSDNDIVTFCFDPKGYLWICTESAVLTV